MRLSLKVLAAIFVGLLPLSLHAAHTQAELVLSAATARPGDTLLAGVHLKMDAHWHTYWRNPGESGMATKIDWQLPAGVTAGEIQWPVPDKMVESGLTTYIYQNEVVLLVPLKLADNLPPGSLELKAHVSWLECNELCVPGGMDVAARLNIGAESQPSTNAALLKNWRQQIPQTIATVAAKWDGTPTNDTRTLTIEWETSMKAAAADFFADASDDYEVSPVTKFLPGGSAANHLQLTMTKFGKVWPQKIRGLLISHFPQGNMDLAEDDEVVVDIDSTTPASATTAALNTTTAPPIPGTLSLWQMLFFAFLGGLILNVMPCVLPVIALKILGFVRQTNDEPRRVRKLGLIYGVGVLVSFLALAALVIGVQAAGHKAGWGMQFRSPAFIVGLTALVTLVALNLFGVFEVTLGGGALNAAGKLAGKHGSAGAFFNGVLMTALATPCTAPFLAPALGFAFGQTAPVIILFFATIGVGLALPYMALSWHPAWLKFLPKPGAWMEKFKIAMGFPMLGTAVWLYDVATAYYGERTWWLGIFLVVLALAAWVFGEFVQRGRRRKVLAWAVVLALLATDYGYALEKNLRWRTALADLGDVPLKESADGIEWRKWSVQAVTRARASGRPVLVDFTAKWCSTCRVNKAVALEIPAVREKLKTIKAVALLGDYTRFSDDITAELFKFGRAGVPLVLVYPADASQPPAILPALLTPGIVLEALDKATMKLQ